MLFSVLADECSEKSRFFDLSVQYSETPGLRMSSYALKWINNNGNGKSETSIE